MDITMMTIEELKELKKDIDVEIRTRYKDAYNRFEKEIINMIKNFEKDTGLFIGFDLGDYEDTAVGVIEAYMYYSTDYIEPYK